MVAEETAITIAQTVGQLLQQRHPDTYYQTMPKNNQRAKSCRLGK